MIIETKYNTLDEFLCQFEGVQILSVEFEYDFARYTLGFRDYIEERNFKHEYEVFMSKVYHLNKCLNKEFNNVELYKPIKKNSNIFRKVD